MLITVKRLRLHIDEFSDKLTKMAIFFVYGCNFFCVENRENILLSTDRNMVFSQILSHIPLVYDQWLPRFANYPSHQLSRLHLGELPAGKWGQPPKTNFKQGLNHLSGFESYTFFDFQKKFFSLHPSIHRSSQNIL